MHASKINENKFNGQTSIFRNDVWTCPKRNGPPENAGCVLHKFSSKAY